MISYEECVKDIILNEKIQQLNNYNHHFYSTRLDHSIDVARITYRLCTYFKMNDNDIKEAVVAALVHDLFLYNWRSEGYSSKQHTFEHAKNAYLTASEIIDLSDKQKNIILSHMFPTCVERPKYLASWIVQLADKISAVKDYSSQFRIYSLQLRPMIYLFNLMLVIRIR